ncbi:hypothetical protein VaNZ11_008583, partial [Volvox africanus]
PPLPLPPPPVPQIQQSPQLWLTISMPLPSSALPSSFSPPALHSRLVDYQFLTTFPKFKGSSPSAVCTTAGLIALAEYLGLPTKNVTANCMTTNSGLTATSRKLISDQNDVQACNQPSSIVEFKVDPSRDMAAFKERVYNILSALPGVCPLGPLEGSWAITGFTYQGAAGAPTPPPPGNRVHVNMPAVISGAIGGTCLLVLALVVLLVAYRRRKQQQSPSVAPSPQVIIPASSASIVLQQEQQQQKQPSWVRNNGWVEGSLASQGMTPVMIQPPPPPAAAVVMGAAPPPPAAAAGLAPNSAVIAPAAILVAATTPMLVTAAGGDDNSRSDTADGNTANTVSNMMNFRQQPPPAEDGRPAINTAISPAAAPADCASSGGVAAVVKPPLKLPPILKTAQTTETEARAPASTIIAGTAAPQATSPCTSAARHDRHHNTANAVAASFTDTLDMPNG